MWGYVPLKATITSQAVTTNCPSPSTTSLPNNFNQFQSFFENDTNGTLKDDVIKQLVNNSDPGYQKATGMIGDDGYSHAIESIGTWAS